MACFKGISAAITNNCANTPVAGLEAVAYVFNRTDATFTVDGTHANKITAIALAGSTLAYKVTAVKRELNAGFDLATADNLPNRFKHMIEFQPYDRDPDVTKALDEIDDLCIVVETKGLKSEGCFILLGVESGLKLEAATGRVNDNNGIPTYTFATREDEGERFSRYIYWVAADTYAATKAAIEALTIP